MRMPSVHDGGGAVERALEVTLIGGIANRIRHYALTVGDHAVRGNDDVAFNAAQSGDAGLEHGEIAQQ